MDLQTFYIIYLIVMGLTAVLNFALIMYGWRHRGAPGATGFIAIMAASGGYALFNILVILSPTRASTILTAKIGFVCAAAVTPAWLIFALQFSRRHQWLTWRRQLLLIAPQILAILAVWSNEWHKLAWPNYIIREVGEFVLLDVTFGPVLWGTYGYTFLTVIVGALILVSRALSATRLYRRQVWAVLLAVSFPLLISLLYVFRIVELFNVDFIPLGFALSGMTVVWGVWRYHPFQLVPTARAVLIETMEEGVIVLNRSQEIIDVNKAAQRILSLPPAGVIGYPVSQVLPSWLELPLSTTTRRTRTIDVQQPLSEDDWAYFELKVTPLQDEQMNLAGWLILLHDITVRKDVEAQLRQQAQELEILSQISAAMRKAETVDEMIQVGLTRAVEGLYAAFGSIFLWDEESEGLEGLSLRAAYPSYRPNEQLVHKKGEGITGYVARRGEPYMTENVMADPQANILPEEWSIVEVSEMKAQLSLPLRVQEQVIGVMHIGLRQQRPFQTDEIRLATAVADITASGIHRALMLQGLEEEVKARTGDIRAEQEKQATILNSVNDAIVMTDLHYLIHYVNKGFTQLTGYRKETVNGQNVLVLLGEAMEKSRRHLLRQSLEQGHSWQGEVTLMGQDGRLYEAALVAAPVYDSQSDPIGFVFSHQDITHLKKLDQARRQFMINVSHQLRTPVANIKLYTDLLRMKQQPEKQVHYLKVLAEQTERLEHLVGDILDMTALDSGRGLQAWDPIKLTSLIEMIETRYREMAEEIKIDFTIRPLPPTLPLIQGDKSRLTQAISELLTNAFIFTPSGEGVNLSVEHIREVEGEFITIHIEDSGPGIPPGEQSHIFERFYRGEQAADGSLSGTGLGLSLVKEIMQLHGGQVTVHSRVGVGSRFSLRLPVMVKGTP